MPSSTPIPAAVREEGFDQHGPVSDTIPCSRPDFDFDTERDTDADAIANNIAAGVLGTIGSPKVPQIEEEDLIAALVTDPDDDNVY